MKTTNDEWTTLFDPKIVDQFGHPNEVHNVWFLPLSEKRHPVVGLLIPECELQMLIIPATNDEPVAVVNRPQHNKNVKQWLRYACSLATGYGGPLSLACDTAQQAKRFAKLAAHWLPNHRRIALERMYQPETRTFKGLS